MHQREAFELRLARLLGHFASEFEALHRVGGLIELRFVIAERDRADDGLLLILRGVSRRGCGGRIEIRFPVARGGRGLPALVVGLREIEVRVHLRWIDGESFIPGVEGGFRMLKFRGEQAIVHKRVGIVRKASRKFW